MNAFSSYSPVGKFIFLTSHDPNVLADDTALSTSLSALIFKIKDCIAKNGLVAAQQKTEDDLFSIRFDILEFFKTNPGILKSFEAGIVSEIGKKYFTPGVFKELGKVVSDTLGVYLSMFSNLDATTAGNIGDVAAIPLHVRTGLSINMLRHVNLLQPNPELATVIEWFSASLKYDFYLLAADFIINNEIIVDAADTQLLPSLLRRSIIDFGAYTVLSGLWQPAEDDENQYVRNIKIKAAAHRMEKGMGTHLSLQDVNDLLHA